VLAEMRRWVMEVWLCGWRCWAGQPQKEGFGLAGAMSAGRDAAGGEQGLNKAQPLIPAGFILVSQGCTFLPGRSARFGGDM